jgi:hypothetical protein
VTAEAKVEGFGTFKGVFTPSILTILGVIMYLRLGWVLGNVGLPLTLVIVTLASSITFLTSLSIAATATNMRVGIGGAYFMISRSLGVEAGAAIGVPLFFAQALGISFYIVGFAESLNNVFPFLPPKVIGVATLTLLAVLAYKSADLALKSQLFIMGDRRIARILFRGRRVGRRIRSCRRNPRERVVLGRVRRVLPGRHRDRGGYRPLG